VSAVETVQTDMDAHTVTVRFDDEGTSIEAIVEALNNEGYTVPERSKIE
jgi:copper chaperone CopZ